MSPRKLSTPSTLTKTPEAKETFEDVLASYDENKNQNLDEKTVFDDQALKKTLEQQNRYVNRMANQSRNRIHNPAFWLVG